MSCTRCGRPACPECLTPASVGFQCRQCVADFRAATGGRGNAPRTVAGAALIDRPIVTPVLIAINVVAFLTTAVQAGSAIDVSASQTFVDGALIPAEVASGQYWRLLTSGFLHGSLIHIAANMLSLYFLGGPLERILGRGRFLVLYLVSMLGSAVSVMLFSLPVSLTIGASGAIYGLLGALVVAFKRMRADLRSLIVVVAINFWITFQFPGISWQGHLGGLVAGAIIGAAMVYPPPRTRAAWQWGTVAATVVVLLVVLVVRDQAIGQWICATTPDQVSCIPAHFQRPGS